jgi:hypothetical protein
MSFDINQRASLSASNPFPSRPAPSHQACSFTWTNGRLRMNHRSSYSGTLTQRYDDYAMKHLAGTPLRFSRQLQSLIFKP